MVTDLSRSWWVLALRGVVGIVFGVGAFVWPDATLAALVLVFGAYVLVDGIFAIVAGIRMRKQIERWWLLILEGVAGIILGVVTSIVPGITLLVLLSYIAAWALITGVFEIATAVRLRKLIANEWLLLVSGIVSIVFGLLLIVFPGPGALSLVLLIGTYALIFGALELFLSFRLHGMREQMGNRATGAA